MKSWRVNLNVEKGEKAETTIRATAFPPYGPKFNEMYGLAEGAYFKQSHEDRWLKALDLWMAKPENAEKRPEINKFKKPFRLYGRLGFKMKDKASADLAVSLMAPYAAKVFTSSKDEVIREWYSLGIGGISITADAEGYIRLGGCMIQSEKLIIDILNLKSLDDLSGYK